MKIYSLMENTPYQPGFASEHGLSLYIETDQHKILFDFGQSGNFADNAARLGIDLCNVDIAILSHGHYDHGGGISRFLEMNSHAPIYLSRHAFGGHFHGLEKYIGLDQKLADNDRLIFTEDYLKIDDELELCSCNDQKANHPVDSAGLTCRQNDSFVAESFLHEQYLTIHDGNRTVLISGCSHKGILNIMEWLHPDVLVGGFHFMKQEIPENGNPILDEAATILSGYDTTYYTCHCTGREQFKYLKEKMETRLHYLASGQVITIPAASLQSTRK